MLRHVAPAVSEQPASWLADLRGQYQGCLLDIGTGDGKYLLKRAAKRPTDLLIGVDAALDSLQEGAKKASRKPSRGGAENIIFCQANVLTEPLPELRGIASEITINFPWADLLAATARPDSAALQKFATWAQPGVPFEVFLNLQTFKDVALREKLNLPELTEDYVEQTLLPAYAAAGWQVEATAWLGPAELKQHGSSWAGRLIKGSGRSTLHLKGALANV